MLLLEENKMCNDHPHKESHVELVVTSSVWQKPCLLGRIVGKNGLTFLQVLVNIVGSHLIMEYSKNITSLYEVNDQRVFMMFSWGNL